MKKETRIFPLENLVSIEIDRENGVALATYEEKKQELKVGEWYNYNGFTILLSEIGNSGICWGFGFNQNNCWHASSVMPFGNSHGAWQPANMKEVEKLLIKEAEKRYSEECRIKSMKHIGTENNMSKGNYEDRLTDEGLYFSGNLTFSFKSGKWAEIIEEKKPLYTNGYGTEFFEGDECFFVRKDTLGLETYVAAGAKNMKEGQNTSEIMTRKECYKWIAENYDWLSENL